MEHEKKTGPKAGEGGEEPRSGRAGVPAGPVETGLAVPASSGGRATAATFVVSA